MENKMKYIVEEGTNRSHYAFLLTIGDKIVRVINKGWFNDESIMEVKTIAAATARTFKKTAGIMVYREAETNGGKRLWRLVDTCSISRNVPLSIIRENFESFEL